jgi:hypothetical protein
MASHCLVKNEGPKHSRIAHHAFAIGLWRKGSGGKSEVSERRQTQNSDVAVVYGKDYSILQTPAIATEAQLGACGPTGKNSDVPGSRSKNSAHPGRIFRTSGSSLGSGLCPAVAEPEQLIGVMR